MTEVINKAWADFLTSLGEKDESLYKKIGCPLLEFLDEQKYWDRIVSKHKAKRPHLNSLLRRYLEEIDLASLHQKMQREPQIFKRAFGPHNYILLQLLIDLRMLLPRRGLLAS